MNWKLTQAAIDAGPKIDEWDSPGGEITRSWPEEDLTLGYSFLRALAESDETLVEVHPGVWRHTGPDAGNSGPGRWPRCIVCGESEHVAGVDHSIIRDDTLES